MKTGRPVSSAAMIRQDQGIRRYRRSGDFRISGGSL